MLVADRGGPTMFARIGVMRALNRHDRARVRSVTQGKALGPAQTRARSMKREAVGGRGMGQDERWRHRSNWLASRSLGCTPNISTARPSHLPIFLDATQSN
jgi:hypothetical protein